MTRAFTDGSCLRNPRGPAGAGVVLVRGREVTVAARSLGVGSNNLAELHAVRLALEATRRERGPVTVYTDSQYVVGMLTKDWSVGANHELVAELRAVVQSRAGRVALEWVRGHASNHGNALADKLAGFASRHAGLEFVAVYNDAELGAALLQRAHVELVAACRGLPPSLPPEPKRPVSAPVVNTCLPARAEPDPCSELEWLDWVDADLLSPRRRRP